ncbi:MAG: phenylalanine--tRNA ligase subunit beta, partial [Rubrivivax sp.]
VLRYNLARRAERVRVFEIGRVYRRDAAVQATATQVAGVDQPLRIAGLAWGPVDELQWGVAERNVDFFDVKGDVQALLAPLAARWLAAEHPALHPGRSAHVELDGRSVGWCGELHPRWCRLFDLPRAPVVFELDLEATLARPVPQAQPLPKLQSVTRDVSLLVPSAVAHDALADTAMADASGVTRSVRLFDLYIPPAASGSGATVERRMALRIELRDDAQTLTDERIEESLRATLQRLQHTLGVRARLA